MERNTADINLQYLNIAVVTLYFKPQESKISRVGLMGKVARAAVWPTRRVGTAHGREAHALALSVRPTVAALTPAFRAAPASSTRAHILKSANI
jgi:hypothetical protein